MNYPKMQIERAEPEDFQSIMRIRRAAWLDSYVDRGAGVTKSDVLDMFPEHLQEELAKKNLQALLRSERHDDQRATFVSWFTRTGTTAGYITTVHREGKFLVDALYVDPEHQGKGIGGDLIDKVIDSEGHSNDIYLRVVDYNTRAQVFYQRHGFEATGESRQVEFDDVRGHKVLGDIEMRRPADESD